LEYIFKRKLLSNLPGCNITVIAQDGYCTSSALRGPTQIYGVDNGKKTGGYVMFVKGKLRPGKVVMHYPRVDYIQ